MKRIVSFSLAVLLLLTFLPPVRANAQVVDSGAWGDNLTYTLDDAGTLIVTGTGSTPSYDDFGSIWCDNNDIKALLLSEGVTGIGNCAFEYSGLASAYIPSSVENIGYQAFRGCGWLKNVTICDGVKSIASRAFNYTGVTSIDIPDSVTFIGNFAFDGSALVSATVGSGVTTLGVGIFSFCYELESVVISENVTSIENMAFYDCTKLTDVYFGGTQMQWEAINIDVNNECLLNATVHYESEAPVETTTPQESTAPQETTAPQESTAPQETTTPAETQPEGVVSSGICGDNLTWTFDDQGTLTISGSGDMTDYENEIGGISGSTHPWKNIVSSVKRLVVENGVTSIGDYAIYNFSALTDVTIADSVASIGDWTFCGCVNLPAVKFPEKLKTIGEYAFNYCFALSEINIPDSVSNIGIGAFMACNSANVLSLSNGISYVEDYLFDYCSGLINVTIPDGVSGIGEWAFFGCTGLTQLTLPVSVTVIEESAFQNCSSLTDVYYSGTESQWAAISVQGNNDNLLNADIHFAHGDVMIGNEGYSSLDAALSAARPGQTVTLQTNAQVNEIVIADGITLDVNGYKITVAQQTEPVIVSGHITDSSDGNTGFLAIPRGQIVFCPDNADVPLYDPAAGGYRFFDYELKPNKTTTNDGVGRERFWFNFHFYTDDNISVIDRDAYSIVSAGVSGVEIGVSLTWNDKPMQNITFQKNGEADTFAKDWAGAKGGATQSRWLYVTVSNLDKAGAGTLLVTPVIKVNGVQTKAETVEYKVGSGR